MHEVAGGAGWLTALVAGSLLPPPVTASLSLSPRLVGRLDLVGCCVVARLSLLHRLQLVHYSPPPAKGRRERYICGAETMKDLATTSSNMEPSSVA